MATVPTGEWCTAHQVRLVSPINQRAGGEIRTDREICLKAYQGQGTLHQRFNSILLSYRNTPHETTKALPESLFMKRELRTSFNQLKPQNVKDYTRHHLEKVTVVHNRRVRVLAVSAM